MIWQVYHHNYDCLGLMVNKKPLVMIDEGLSSTRNHLINELFVVIQNKLRIVMVEGNPQI